MKNMIQYVSNNLSIARFQKMAVDEKMKRRLTDSARTRGQITNSTTISWIEKLLQTQIDDHRKFVVWRILVPYPILESVSLMKHPILSGDG